MKVLVVEDDPDCAAAVSRFLRGESVSVTHSVREAIVSLEERMPDVIVADLSLPDSNGIDAYLKLQLAAMDVPIVVLTGHCDRGIGPKLTGMGAYRVFFKDDLDTEAFWRAIKSTAIKAKPSPETTFHHVKNLARQLLEDESGEHNAVPKAV